MKVSGATITGHAPAPARSSTETMLRRSRSLISASRMSVVDAGHEDAAWRAPKRMRFHSR